jgi:ABC-2 type transport system ATP-binding protein
MLTLDHLSFSYNGIPIINEVQAQFAHGIVAFVGTNGAGKTTLLRLMAGLLTPERGSVRWHNEFVGVALESWRRSVGYLPQSPGLYPQMTTHEFLDYMLVLSKWKQKHERHRRIDELVEQLNVSSFLRSRIDTLSGGMRQRVSIAQAFIHKPAVVFLDEPTNNLDYEERERFHRFLTATSKGSDSTTLIFYIGHSIAEMMSVASELIFLHKGSVAFQGTPQTFMTTAQALRSDIASFDEAYQTFRASCQEGTAQ